MHELRRITTSTGWCLIMVPLDLHRATTYEDPSIVAPEDRQRAFWQHDHLRLYATDIVGRLQQAGFEVEVIRPIEEFGPELVEPRAIAEADYIWRCRPRAETPASSPPQT